MVNRNDLKRTCDLINETHEEFIRIRSGIDRLILPITQEYGLTPVQVAVLNLIRKTENATVSSLYRALDFNQGNMSSMCKRLESDGFVEKTKCQNDERKSYLSLTDKGISALDAIDEILNFDARDEWLTAEEFAQAELAVTVLRSAAKRINEKLNEAVSSKNGENNA